MFNPPPGAENFSQAVQNYEPRGPVPLHLQPVETPGNSPAEFARRYRMMKHLATGAAPGRAPARPPHMPGFEGPNIYVRCLLALRSGIPAEEAFALNHLVKISYERGDKYKFESFGGLAEGLTEKALQVGGLFYDVDWSISYDPDSDGNDIGELDGVNGTADILERISQLKPKPVLDSVQTEEFCDQVILITEAALTIRNMVQLPENAYFMAEFLPIRDLICIVLRLPNSESVVELKHCALDIAEQLTPWLILREDDPLYQTLLAQLKSTDRGVILTALRAVGRISSNLTQTNTLGNVPPDILQNIMDWLLLNDDEMMDAGLDFLYQYTAVVSNLDTLLTSVKAENLVTHLVRLLSHGGKRGQRDIILESEKVIPAPTQPPPVPADLLERLVAKDEPDRCYAWLRCLFEEDPDSSITQIAIWQAYQAAFNTKVMQAGRSMLGAAEFIRNVTHVFNSAGAQIQREQGERGEVQMYIIKGIRARQRPVTEKGAEYFRCQWGIDWPTKPRQLCGSFFASVRDMWHHVLTKHLMVTPEDDGKFPNAEKALQCLWWDCTKYREPKQMRLAELMAHIKMHIVNTSRSQTTQSQQNGAPVSNGEVGSTTPGESGHKRLRRWFVVPARTISLPYEETQTTRDNGNQPLQAAGIPLSAVLVLRNIARNAGKTEAEERLLKQHQEAEGDGGGEQNDTGGWNERLFRPLLPRLFEILTENKAMAPYMTSLIELIQGS